MKAYSIKSNYNERGFIGEIVEISTNKIIVEYMPIWASKMFYLKRDAKTYQIKNNLFNDTKIVKVEIKEIRDNV